MPGFYANGEAENGAGYGLGETPPDPTPASIGAPGYGAARRRYIVKKDGRLLVFTDPELAKAVLHEDDEPEPVKQQPAKKQKQAEPKAIPVATPPEQVIDLAEVKTLADKHRAEAEYKQLMAQQQYEQILDLLERLREEEEDEWLLMAAA